MPSVGILAYGSVIRDPGAEIAAVTVRSIPGVDTAFTVEFARTSGTRGGAPTLVPVTDGGSSVKATVFVVKATEAEATDMLYRREIHQVGSGRRYDPSRKITANSVRIERLENFAQLGVVLYTVIEANVQPRTPENLAALAIESARSRNDGKDGISYLINAKKDGIRTLLSDVYEAEIKRVTGTATLEEALAKIRAGR